MKKRILVFPCGSEVALEIHRSLKYSIHFELIGASSVDDHGRFVFKNYINGLPFANEDHFLERLRHLVQKHSIDAIYPAMDSVIALLAGQEDYLGCRVIGPSESVAQLCASKIKTYRRLEGIVPVPEFYDQISAIKKYPVFVKPDQGYGSRNVSLIQDEPSVREFVSQRGGEPSFVYVDPLPGDEYTIDCFSDKNGTLHFSGARQRKRISNGISVNTQRAEPHNKAFKEYAEKINESIRPRGAWFFQMKEDESGQPKLLEVAARLGGSSAYFRATGVNFAMLSVFDAFEVPVSVNINNYDVELDRALGSRYRLSITYETVYVDFDDCLLLGDVVNSELVAFLYQALNSGKKTVLITRHERNINDTLEEFRLKQLFDEVVHIKDRTPKSEFIQDMNAIFIDDSFAERREVSDKHGIPVFSPDMIEMLLD